MPVPWSPSPRSTPPRRRRRPGRPSTRPATARAGRHREPVGEHVAGLTGQPRHGPAHAGDVALVQAAGRSRPGDDHDQPRRAGRHDLLVERSRAAAVEQLGVGSGRRSGLPQHDRGDHQRPGAGAAAGLVDPGDGRQPAAGERPLVAVEARLPPDDAGPWGETQPSWHHGSVRHHDAREYARSGACGRSNLDLGRTTWRRSRASTGRSPGTAASRCAKARPITSSSEIVPVPSVLMWNRESAEAERWSPITHSRPCGHRHVERVARRVVAGVEVGVSSSGTPLTVIRFWASQHFTVSPPTPMTRLIGVLAGPALEDDDVAALGVRRAAC